MLTTIDSVCNYGKCNTVSVDSIFASDWVLELEDIEKDSGNILQFMTKSNRVISGSRHSFKSQDVLYSKLRTYLNKVLLAPKKGYCTTEIIPVSAYGCITPDFLCLWLRSPYFLDYTLSCGYGVKMPRLSTSDARNGIVPLPPINEQKRIVDVINRLFSMLNDITESLS